MRLKGNTVFITGGGSGIGRGLAEALHTLGNKVIIAGRRRSHLDAVVAANPGMAALELDIADLASIDRAAKQLITEHTALIEHLKTKDGAVIAYPSSVLGFVPLAATAVYSSTKAALHSYALSQRFMLRDSKVRVLEIVPPWVRTELMNSQEAEQAMPLEQFIAEAIKALGTDANEIVIAAAKPLRDNVGPAEHGFVDAFNARMLSLFEERQSVAG
jgi:uncharacterized oxidoreductase